MLRIVAITLLLFTSRVAAQQWSGILDPSRASSDWTEVGIKDVSRGIKGIPRWTTICNVNATPPIPGADGNPLPPVGATLVLGNTHYNVGDKIVDGVNIQTAVTAGTSAPRYPNFSTTVGGTTQDGTVTWTMVGPPFSGPPLYTPTRWYQNVAYVSPSGTANISGTTVTFVSGTNFSGLIANDVITIAGVPYRISSVATNSLTLTLTTAPGDQTGVSFTAGSAIMDTNSNYEIATTAGTSQAWPSFSPTGQTPDGSVVWQGTANASDGPRIQAALMACDNPTNYSAPNANGVVVQLQAGTYYVFNGLNFNRTTNSSARNLPIRNVILRGAGTDSTILQFINVNALCSTGAVCFAGSVAYEGWFMNAGRNGGISTWIGTDTVGAYNRGSSKLILGQAWWGTAPQVGDVIILDQSDDDTNICPQSGGVGPCAGLVGASVSWSGTTGPNNGTVTINTGVPHNLQAGDCVGIGSMGGGGLNAEDWSIYSSAGCQRNAANNACASPPAWSNQGVSCTPQGTTTTIGRFFPVTSVPTATSFTYTVPAAGSYTDTTSPNPTNPIWMVKGTSGVLISGINGVTYPIGQGIKTGGRKCPGTGNTSTSGNAPMPDCPPGEERWRTLREWKKILSIDQPGINGCAAPAGGMCYTVDPPLQLTNYLPSHNPGIWWVGTNSDMDGMEELTIDMSNDRSTSNGYGGIDFAACYNCWVKGVRTVRGRRNATWASGNGRMAAVDGYAYGVKRVDNQSYLFELWQTSNSLIQNNICQQMATCLMMGTGIDSIYAYNFTSQEAWRTPSQMQQQIQYNHDNSVLSLFEGNVAISGAHSDNFHGSNALSTLFRNRLTAQGWPMRLNLMNGVDNRAFNRGHNFIGNVLGGLSGSTVLTRYQNDPAGSGLLTNVWSLATFDTGVPAEPFTIAGYLRWGNFDTATASTRWCDGTTTDCSCGSLTSYCSTSTEIPGAQTFINANPIPSSHTLPASFYFTAQPDFWVTPWGTPGWPAIGPDVAATGPLDSQCTWNKGTGADNYGMHSPFGCSGVTNIPTNHMAYQTPAQLCYNNTPIDPFYQQGPFTITGITPPSGNLMTITFTPPIRPVEPNRLPTYELEAADTINVQGVNESAYNGLRTVNDPLGIPAPNQVVVTAADVTSAPPYTGGGTFTTRNVIKFNARTCYPNEFGPAAPVPPVILTFNVSPSSIQPGGSATLNWTVDSTATSASITPPVGTVRLPTGSATVSPAQTTQYVLTATNANGTSPQSAATLIVQGTITVIPTIHGTGVVNGAGVIR